MEHISARLKFHDTVRQATMYPREHQLRRYLRGWNSIREQRMVHDGYLDDAASSARWYTKRRVEISNVYIEPMEQTSHEGKNRWRKERIGQWGMAVILRCHTCRRSWRPGQLVFRFSAFRETYARLAIPFSFSPSVFRVAPFHNLSSEYCLYTAQ